MRLRSEKIEVALILMLFTIMVNSCIGSCEEPPSLDNFGYLPFIEFTEKGGTEVVKGDKPTDDIQIANRYGDIVGKVEYIYSNPDVKSIDADSIVVTASGLIVKKACRSNEIIITAEPMKGIYERKYQILLNFGDDQKSIIVNQRNTVIGEPDIIV